MLYKFTSAKSFKQDFQISTLTLFEKLTSNYISFHSFFAYKIVKIMLINANDKAYLISISINRIFYNKFSFTIMQQYEKSYTSLIF